MSRDNLKNFCALVMQKISLQETLRDISDTEEFIARLIESGRENGFEFSPEDVREAIRENQRAWIERWI